MTLGRDSVTPRKAQQHHLRRRLRCRPSWLPRIDAFECSVCVLQIAPHDALYQHQHTQRDTPQADQGDAPLFVRQQQGRQRSGASWQPPEALFNQVRSCDMRRPPGPGSTPRRCDWSPRHASPGAARGARASPRRSPPIHAHAHDAPWSPGAERDGSLVCRRFVRPARLALLAFIPRVELGDGARRVGTSSAPGVRPPFWPRARATASPARVRACIKDHPMSNRLPQSVSPC